MTAAEQSHADLISTLSYLRETMQFGIAQVGPMPMRYTDVLAALRDWHAQVGALIDDLVASPPAPRQGTLSALAASAMVTKFTRCSSSTDLAGAWDEISSSILKLSDAHRRAVLDAFTTAAYRVSPGG